MILDAEGRPAKPEISGGPAVTGLLEAMDLTPVRFVVDPSRHGVDALCLEPVSSAQNRARVKIFAADPHTVLAFLYKDSQVPFSSDRFAYGALVVKNRHPLPAEMDAVIEYLASGFHPEKRPACVRRAFPFTIPR